MTEGTVELRRGKCSQVRIGNNILGDFEQWMHAHPVRCWPFCRLLKITCLDINRHSLLNINWLNSMNRGLSSQTFLVVSWWTQFKIYLFLSCFVFLKEEEVDLLEQLLRGYFSRGVTMCCLFHAHQERIKFHGLVLKINPPTFGTFFIQVDAPFETIRYCGFEWWNNCVDSPIGFEW